MSRSQTTVNFIISPRSSVFDFLKSTSVVRYSDCQTLVVIEITRGDCTQWRCQLLTSRDSITLRCANNLISNMHPSCESDKVLPQFEKPNKKQEKKKKRQNQWFSKGGLQTAKSTDQLHLRTWWESKIGAAIQTSGMRNTEGWSPEICTLTSLPGGSDACSSLRTTEPGGSQKSQALI